MRNKPLGNTKASAISFGVAMVCAVGCAPKGEGALVPGRDREVQVFAAATDLPACTASRNGSVVYTRADAKFMFCDGTRYQPLVITGTPGQDGKTWLVSQAPAPVAVCPAGGTVFATGADLDGDGVLDGAEVASTAAVCNGRDGADGQPGAMGRMGATGSPGPMGLASLIRTSVLPVGRACPAGGVLLEHGVDDDGNGILDDGEVDGSSPLCNGTNTCDPGYTGPNCDIDADDCTGNPCQNGGVCEDGLARYVCQCPVGFGGANCETAIDNCASRPCLNGGTCSTTARGYVCACPDAFSGINCEIAVDPHSRLVHHSQVPSAFLRSRSRDVMVYLPPGYYENPTRSYPVLYMQDGQNLFDPAIASLGVAWEVDAAMDRLIAGGDIIEAIVVGVYNSPDRVDEYTPTSVDGFGGGSADTYLRFLTDELIPYIAARYRTSGPRVGLMGSSLGGLFTLYACWKQPEIFDRCGVLSPSLWWDDQVLFRIIDQDPAGAAEKQIRIYLDPDHLEEPPPGEMTDAARMQELLVQKGFVLGDNLAYVLGADHRSTEASWAARTPGALRFLLRN